MQTQKLYWVLLTCTGQAVFGRLLLRKPHSSEQWQPCLGLGLSKLCLGYYAPFAVFRILPVTTLLGRSQQDPISVKVSSAQKPMVGLMIWLNPRKNFGITEVMMYRPGYGRVAI